MSTSELENNINFLIDMVDKFEDPKLSEDFFKKYFNRTRFSVADRALKEIAEMPTNDRDEKLYKLEILSTFNSFLLKFINYLTSSNTFKTPTTKKLNKDGRKLLEAANNTKRLTETIIDDIPRTPVRQLQTAVKKIAEKKPLTTLSDLPRENLFAPITSFQSGSNIPVPIQQPQQQVQYNPQYLTVMRGISNRIDTSNRYLKDIDTELMNYIKYRKQLQPSIQPVKQSLQPVQRKEGSLLGYSSRHR